MAVGFGVAPRDALHGHDFPGVQPADPLVERPSFPKRKPLFQAPTWPTRLRWHVRRFRYAQATKPPRYLMRILPDSLERRTHASLLTQRELSKGGKT